MLRSFLHDEERRYGYRFGREPVDYRSASRPPVGGAKMTGRVPPSRLRFLPDQRSFRERPPDRRTQAPLFESSTPTFHFASVTGLRPRAIGSNACRLLAQFHCFSSGPKVALSPTEGGCTMRLSQPAKSTGKSDDRCRRLARHRVAT